MKQPKRARLGEDVILFSILPRLPAKALSRFKCVSKNWHDSISSNPHFIRLQFQWAPRLLFKVTGPRAIQIHGDQRSVGFPCLSNQFNMRLRMVVASCNGILAVLCFHKRPTDLYEANAMPDRKLQLYVGNPVLKDWRRVPKPKHSTVYYPCGFGLVVDVKQFAASYKLVVPFSVHDSLPSFDIYNPVTEYRFEVLSSETGSWEVSKERIILDGTVLLDLRTVTVMGALYWKFGAENVLWFDPKEECSGLLPLPSDSDANEKGRIGEWDGKLSYTTINDGKIRLWIMDKVSWSMMHCVSIEFIVERNLGLFASLYLPKMRLKRKIPSRIVGRWLRVAKPIGYEGGGIFLFSVDCTIFTFDMKTMRACYIGPNADWFAYKNTLISMSSP
ncbi:putative F-box protein [Cocos nucifera]|nr:putative F-box protein [Cocos nucifera]